MSHEVLRELPTDLIALMALVAIIWGTIVIRAGQITQGSKITDMHKQVTNDHPKTPNLRDDIDYIKGLIEGIVPWREQIHQSIAAIGDDLAAVRRELHDERQRSIGADEALHRMVTAEVARSTTRDDQIARDCGK